MLTAVDKRKLRQSAHHLKPIVLVGQQGLSAAVLAEIERALFDHELIKIRFRGMGRELRTQEIARAAAALDAEVVGSVGGTAVLYRRKPEQKRRRSPS
ncbi:MAG: ribosome assembly RNA-binding protein YhbY [Gammaproteobacteria bacterium]